MNNSKRSGKMDEIGRSCAIAKDSVNTLRESMYSILSELRSAPREGDQYIRTNALGSALVELRCAEKRLKVLTEFVLDLREKAFNAMSEGSEE